MMENEKMRGLKYAVKTMTCGLEGSLRKYKYIALVDEDTKLVVKTEHYEDLVLYLRNKDMSLNANNDAALYAITNFLNWLFKDNYSKYGISDISEIAISHLEDYLSVYTNTKKDGKYPTKKSVIDKRDNLSVFLCGLIRVGIIKNISEDELVEYKRVRMPDLSDRNVPEYKIKIKYHIENNGIQQLQRDMPLEIIERFVAMAEIYDPELAFAIILMAFVGLREGEVCNVRRVESCYGAGIIITYDGIGDAPEITSMSFCLPDTLVMRGDHIATGRIKGLDHREVYAGFLPIVSKYYKRHLEITKDKPIERFGPMFLNLRKQGGYYRALTKRNLQWRINHLFWSHVLPSCATDSNAKLRRFYAEMLDRTWGAHAFRHWFTVSLVLNGCDEVTIQTLRGDRNRESAKRYLERKGELQRLYSNAVNILGEVILNEKL